MFVTADQLICHAIGDYVLQSDWQATEKTRRSLAAAVHAVTYALPFLFFAPSPTALVVIVGTHFVIDRWRLARYVVWAKNWLAPWPMCPSCHGPISPDAGVVGVWSGECPQDRRPHRLKPTPSWSLCTATGYPPSTPPWLATWLLIIADNLMHVLINGAALKYL